MELLVIQQWVKSLNYMLGLSVPFWFLIHFHTPWLLEKVSFLPSVLQVGQRFQEVTLSEVRENLRITYWHQAARDSGTVMGTVPRMITKIWGNFWGKVFLLMSCKYWHIKRSLPRSWLWLLSLLLKLFNEQPFLTKQHPCMEYFLEICGYTKSSMHILIGLRNQKSYRSSLFQPRKERRAEKENWTKILCFNPVNNFCLAWLATQSYINDFFRFMFGQLSRPVCFWIKRKWCLGISSRWIQGKQNIWMLS